MLHNVRQSMLAIRHSYAVDLPSAYAVKILAISLQFRVQL